MQQIDAFYEQWKLSYIERLRVAELKKIRAQEKAQALADRLRIQKEWERKSSLQKFWAKLVE